MRILFIHGRAQEGKDELVLSQTWKDALTQSFKNAELDVPDHLDFDFPYYGNELVRLEDEYHEAIKSGEYKLRGMAVDPAARLEKELLYNLAEDAKINQAEALKEFGPDELERSPLNHKIPLFIIRALDKYSRRIGNASISLITKDVAAYLAVPVIRSRINAMVKAKLTTEPTVVVAHSLGTIIAYDLLRKLSAEEADIKGLITLGSPLGVNSVQRQFEGQLIKPACIAGDWLNVYDKLDLVSLNPLDDKHFNITPPITNHLMENNSENHHGIVEYLSDPRVAIQVVQ